MEYVVLANGVKVPIVGLGVSRAKNGEEAINAIKFALQSGYRHIDTAWRYFNEESVGIAIKESGVPREEIFVTTKVANAAVRAGETLENFNDSLEKLGLDYVDLYLIHWPVDGMCEAWKIMEELYKQGKARAIGVCNFHQSHLDELMQVATIKPMVNQVESNPRFNNAELIKNCQAQDIAMEAWSPLGGGGTSMRTSEDIIKIGEKYGKSPVQVIIRWDIQRKVIVIPKSVTPQRLIDNINVFDFELSSEDMEIINSLNQNIRTGGDPDNFDF
ncbi:MAG: aldo/keto reductase [Clostridia bacterium]